MYRLAHSQGAFGYVDPASLPNLSPEQHSKFIDQLSKEYERSQERFIKHFENVYGDVHKLPPYWMVTELMTFGTLLTLFRGSPAAIKKEIALRFGVADAVLESWLKTLNTIRNICAHHGRLWNRELGYKPMIPRKDRQWHEPAAVTGNRMFGVLTILKYMLNEVAPQSGWSGRLQDLFSEYPEIPRESMGYPDNWEECPIWVSE